MQRASDRETPIDTTEGLSRQRERRWGWTAAVLGVAVGLGSAAVAVFVEGANALYSGPYPPFFATRRILAYDMFVVAVVLGGAVFGVAAVILARRSQFPRTDALGAALTGTILMVLGAALMFTRLVAIVRGP